MLHAREIKGAARRSAIMAPPQGEPLSSCWPDHATIIVPRAGARPFKTSEAPAALGVMPGSGQGYYPASVRGFAGPWML